MADVDQALKIKPNLPRGILTRAMLLADSKRLDEAVEELEKLRAIQPDDSLSTLQLAVLYSAQKKTRKAIDTYTLVLAQDPKEWRALRGRGDLYLNMGRQADAVADYEMALTLQPKDQGILNNLAWTLATSMDDNLRNGKRALELATQACEVSQYKEAYILSTLAAAYAETGDFANAIKWSTKAVEISEKEHLEALKKELETYKAGKPMRESLSAEPSVDNKKNKPAAKP
jgi:tetratricopeptide (TPR) repeat protein